MGNRSEHIASWAVVTYAQNILRQTVSVGVKTLSNALLVASRHVKRERPHVKLKGGTEKSLRLSFLIAFL